MLTMERRQMEQKQMERKQHETDEFGRVFYMAGERVKPGVYHQIGTRREVTLDYEDTLPTSLDGKVAYYERVPNASDRYLG